MIALPATLCFPIRSSQEGVFEDGFELVADGGGFGFGVVEFFEEGFGVAVGFFLGVGVL